MTGSPLRIQWSSSTYDRDAAGYQPEWGHLRWAGRYRRWTCRRDVCGQAGEGPGGHGFDRAMEFLRPVSVGDEVSCYCSLVKAGDTSLTVRLRRGLVPAPAPASPRRSPRAPSPS
jgi:hypothetical protein